jgi:hypothetical protein
MQLYVDGSQMKTNVMIRIDEETVQKAKALELNISKICEEALENQVKEELQPYGLIQSQQIIFDAELYYHESTRLLVVFNVTNASEENVILDRITYSVDLGGPADTSFYSFTGAMLRRRTIEKGTKEKFIDDPQEGLDLVDEMKKKSVDIEKDVKWVITPSLYANSKRGILQGQFQEVSQPRNEAGDISYRSLKISRFGEL